MQNNKSTTTKEERRKGVIDSVPDYSDDDKKYLGILLSDLEIAKEARGQVFEEFGNMTYLQRYRENRNKSITVLPPKKNVEDVIISAGTVEIKLEAVLSSINSLDLKPKVRAFDKNDNSLSEAGQIMEDSMHKSQELDEDDEKKLHRQKEMFIQGEVFVEESWEKRWRKNKKLNQKFEGQFKGIDWSESLKKVEEGPSRKVLYGPEVYLGDITQYYMKDQPFIFKVKVDTFDKAKAVFGKWDNWKYVEANKERAQAKSGPTDIAGVQDYQGHDLRWSLTKIKENQVEIIVYQNRAKNEYNIIINGVMMLPAEFPLSAISPAGEYTIEKQVYKNVDANFAYGKGFIATAQQASDLLDEMLKLSILKTRKSFMPPYINISRKYISPRVLHAGKITMGLSPDALQPLGDTSEGVTQSEFSLIQKLQDTIDKQTVSPQFTGQQGKSGTTATEVLELRKQAEMTLGLMVFSASLLEKKIGYQRLHNMIENWFEPIDKQIIGDKPVNKYRNVIKETNIEREGMGERKTMFLDPSEPLPSPEEVRELEKQAKKEYGFPVQFIFAKAEEMKKAVKKWYIVVTPTEKDTSELNKVMFREELIDLASLMQFGAMPNVDEIEETYARIYGKDKAKAFVKGGAPQMQPGQDQEGNVDPNQIQPGRANAAGVPTLNNVKQ